MLRPSRERVLRLSREILDALSRTPGFVLLKDRDAVLNALASALGEELRRDEEREQTVRARLSAMPDAPPQDSAEWQELFRRLVEEESVRDATE